MTGMARRFRMLQQITTVLHGAFRPLCGSVAGAGDAPPRRRLRGLMAYAMLAVLGATACEPDRATRPTGRIQGAVSAQRPRFLPYGTKVPVGQRAAGLPEPYNPVRHPRPLGSVAATLRVRGWTPPKMPRAIMKARVGPAGWLTMPQGAPRAATPAGALGGPKYVYNVPETGAGTDGNAGRDLVQGRGLYGLNSHDPNFQVPTDDGDSSRVIYAPTHMPANGSCIEMTAVHEVNPNFTQLHVLAFFDWCGVKDFRAPLDLTSQDFQNKYVRSSDIGGPAYTFEIVAENPYASSTDSDCWDAYLYNYVDGGYERAYQSCGVSQSITDHGNHGWTMWESYHMMTACYPVPSISVAHVLNYDLTYDPSTGTTTPYWNAWNPASLNEISMGGCWSGPYSFAVSLDPDGMSWTAHTPS